MTQHDDRVRIRHALDAARKIVESTKGWRRQDLDLEQLPTLGLIRLLEVVGEAAGLVSEETRTAHPGVPWRKMTGLRNRLIHGYFNVNLDIVWDTIREDLPPLIQSLEEALGTLDRD
ncbi:MAG: DUF86 domain-containing protein [Planctomycetes bacterium]|nr:DUF86 domain-containing protein [Planctomycetota bacterium]